MSDAAQAIEFVPADYLRPLRIDELFSKAGPLEIDVGSGPGAFLIAMATRHPERNFLGIERLLGRVRGTCKAAARLGLSNVRVLRTESGYALQRLLPPASVSVCHIAFPDPWPKRRHWPRRMFNAEFLQAVSTVLVSGGELRIKTDDAPYFSQIGKVVAARTDFRGEAWPEEPDYPRTNFERGFLAKGVAVHSLRLVKV